MNQFLIAAKQLIALHGESCVYTKVTSGSYDTNTGSVTNSEIKTPVIAYRKHLKATQYNYPNLIGKDALILYLPADSIFDTPTVNDKVQFTYTKVDDWLNYFYKNQDVPLDVEYIVDTVQEHTALNQVVFYRITCIKG
jgi:hypothetical protein